MLNGMFLAFDMQRKPQVSYSSQTSNFFPDTVFNLMFNVMTKLSTITQHLNLEKTCNKLLENFTRRQ